DLPRRSPEGLLLLELRNGRAAGAALRARPRAEPARARAGAGRVEPGADDGGGPRRLLALLRRLPGGRGVRLELAARRAGADLDLVAARRDGLPRGPGASPRSAPARRPAGALARRRLPVGRRRLRHGPHGLGALSRRGAGACRVPRERPPRDEPGGRARPPPAGSRRAAPLPSRPRPADDADELRADPGLRPGLPARAVAGALSQPHGAFLLPVPGLSQPGLPF